MKSIRVGLFVVLGSLPLVSLAQIGGNVDNVDNAITFIQDIIYAVIPIIIGLAVLYFLWGLLKYVTAKESDAQKEARSIMFMGIIVLFVMVSVWGLVNLLRETFGLNNAVPAAPGIPSR